jgi:hypothetical protein
VRFSYAHGQTSIVSCSAGGIAKTAFRALIWRTCLIIEQSRKLDVHDLFATKKLGQGEKPFPLEMDLIDEKKENENDSE